MLIHTFLNKKLVVILTLLIFQSFISACQIDKKNIIGRYESKNRNKLYNLLNVNQIKNKVEIKQDSTYVYETCANRITGYWKVFHDSLFLYCTENKYQIDSLNSVSFNGKTKLSCGELPAVLLFSDGKLYEDIYFKGKNEVIHLVYEKQAIN